MLTSIQHPKLYRIEFTNFSVFVTKDNYFFCSLNCSIFHVLKNKKILEFQKCSLFALLPGFPEPDWSGCEVCLTFRIWIDQEGLVCPISLNRIDHAGKGCLICLSRIDWSCLGKLGTSPSVINPAQANMAIRQTIEICDKSRLE